MDLMLNLLVAGSASLLSPFTATSGVSTGVVSISNGQIENGPTSNGQVKNGPRSNGQRNNGPRSNGPRSKGQMNNEPITN